MGPTGPTPPPEVIAVLGRPVTLRIVPGDDLDGDWGRWDEAARVASLRDGQDPFDLRDTALHEVMHAIRTHQGRDYGGKVEEDYVRSLATGLTHVLRDNPAFAKWLIAHPKD